jgi:hypothetical protein
MQTRFEVIECSAVRPTELDDSVTSCGAGALTVRHLDRQSTDGLRLRNPQRGNLYLAPTIHCTGFSEIKAWHPKRGKSVLPTS